MSDLFPSGWWIFPAMGIAFVLLVVFGIGYWVGG